MNFPRDTEHYCAFVSTNNAIVGHIIFYCKLKGFKFSPLSIDSMKRKIGSSNQNQILTAASLSMLHGP